MRTLYAIGEALIDFIPNVTDSDLKDVKGFTRQVGGAPANVASTVAKLKQKSVMLTQLGQDAFGDLIVETLSEIGVETKYVKRSNKANTALAFVSLKENGERDFSFYRKPSADMLYSKKFIDELNITSDDIMHFCSVDLIESDMKEAHQALIEKFLNKGGTIVFDPNVRLPLWENEEDCRKTILDFIPFAHVVKISDEELFFITGEKDEDTAIQSLFVNNVQVVIYTQGPHGATIYLKDGRQFHQEGVKVQPIDTTGAGDAFIGAVITKMLGSKHKELISLFENESDDILKFSNQIAAKVTTRYGAIESLPTLEELDSNLE